MKKENKTEEVKIHEEDLEPKTEENKNTKIWPEHYTTYLGDGIYLNCED